jgi:hypothetical protein
MNNKEHVGDSDLKLHIARCDVLRVVTMGRDVGKRLPDYTLSHHSS